MTNQAEHDRRCIEEYLKRVRPDLNYAVAVERKRGENGIRNAVITLKNDDEE